jgi:hypothetical protein
MALVSKAARKAFGKAGGKARQPKILDIPEIEPMAAEPEPRHHARTAPLSETAVAPAPAETAADLFAAVAEPVVSEPAVVAVPATPAPRAPAPPAAIASAPAAANVRELKQPANRNGIGAKAAKPGYGLVMRTAEGEDSMTPFRSLDDLLSAVKPILRAAVRSPEAVWFSIQQVDLSTIEFDAA